MSSLGNSLATSLGNSLNGGGAGAGGVAPTADAGDDDSHNRFYGAAYTLAGSATGDATITYEWTKVSGTPVPTFVDDTDPETDVTFDVAGAVVLRLTATNDVGSDSDDVEITVTATGVLDDISPAPLAAYSHWRRVLAGYASGELVTIRNASSVSAAIGVTADNVIDEAALAAHVDSGNFLLVTKHDQATGARNLTQATLTSQPIAGLSGVAHKIGTHHASDYDGTVRHVARADALGLSGAQSLTVFIEFEADTMASTRQVFAIGTLGSGTQLSHFSTSTTTFAVNIGGSNRIFTCSDLTTGRHKFLFQLASAAGVGTARCWQRVDDGVATELTELSSLNPLNTTALGTAATMLGASLPPASNFFDGQAAELVVWNAILSDAERAKALLL